MFLTPKIFFFLSPVPVGKFESKFPKQKSKPKKSGFLSTAFKYSLQTIHILTSFYAYLEELLLLSQLLQKTSKFFFIRKQKCKYNEFFILFFILKYPTIEGSFLFSMPLFQIAGDVKMIVLFIQVGCPS